MSSLEYNSERVPLRISEYGRHIQKMVDHCKTIEDKEERLEVANAIVDAMASLNPKLKEARDYKQKLWDHLFMIADFDLDVVPPYEIVKVEDYQQPLELLDYPKRSHRYKFYGQHVQAMIDVGVSWEQGDKQLAFFFVIANHMKKCYLNWNKGSVEDELIFAHLKEISEGKIDLSYYNEPLLDESILRNINSNFRRPKPTPKAKVKKKVKIPKKNKFLRK